MVENEYIGRESIVDIIHDQMKKNNLEESKKHNPKKFYPSSSGKCSRAIVYQMLGYEQEEFDGRTLLIFENGNGMHNRIEHVLGQTGLLIAPEFSFEMPEWRISGRSDAIIHNFLPHETSDRIIRLEEPIFELDEEGNPIRDKDGHKTKVGDKLVYEGPDNDIMIVELKSISDKGFNYLRGKPKEEHVLQLTLYMYLTGIRAGMLLYENKNNQELKEFYVDYDIEMARRIVGQIIYVNEFVDKEELPPREYEETDFQCRYCSYKKYCWPAENTYTLDDLI
jgi:CRISPR/Cas system-associated exonuclease Cas4 (RecB family)